jgi:hypothetical protein
MLAFDEIARATNDVMYLEQTVLSAAAGDPTAGSLDSAIMAMNAAASEWRRDLPRRRALATVYFCETGEFSLMQADRMVDHYFDAIRTVDSAVATQKTARGDHSSETGVGRAAWLGQAEYMRSGLAGMHSSWRQQVDIVRRFEVWMASAVRDERAGQSPGGCDLEK